MRLRALSGASRPQSRWRWSRRRSAACDCWRDTHGGWFSSVAPWPQPGGERQEDARGRNSVVDAYASERNGDGCIQREAVEIDPRAAAHRIQMFGPRDDGQTVEVADHRMVPKDVAFGSRLAC